MSTTHDEQALAAPYVLGALEASERRAFEAHAATCDICREELRALQEVADALGHGVPQRTPRPELRARVLSTITGAAPRVGPSTSRGISIWLPLAASLVVAAGLAAYAWQLQGRVSTLEGRLVSAERRAASAEQGTLEARRVADDAQQAMGVLTAPDLARITLAGQKPAPSASARALWSRSRGMVFAATDLPPAPTGRVYQVWVLAGQQRLSAGLLTVDSSGRATAIFQTPADIPPPTAIAVTLEPAGGVAQPTGDIYLLGAP